MSTTFTVTLTTGSLGTFSGNVTIPTNDPSNNPYSFAITGTVSSNLIPTAGVSNNNNPIADGSTTTSPANGTSFGSVPQGAAAVTQTYTITNSGNGTLNITGNITAPAGFTVTQPLSTSLAPNASTTFTVSLPTSNLGTFAGNVVGVPRNDPNNNPYDFKITGSVAVPAGEGVFLSDLPFVGTPVNGWGPVVRDRSVGAGDGVNTNSLTLKGVAYPKGLGVHAYSSVYLRPQRPVLHLRVVHRHRR